MSAQFDVHADPSRDFIRITASGFFTDSDVTALEDALRDAQARLRCGQNQHLTLCDASGMQIQSQQVVADFARIARDASVRSHRVAFVVGASLARAQARRLPDPARSGVAYFDTAAAAEAWLFDGGVTADRTASRYRRAPASPRSDDRDCTARSAA